MTRIVARFLIIVVTLCGIPGLLQAQQQNPAPQQQPQSGGTTYDPAMGPLSPVPSPASPSTPAPQTESTTSTAPAQKQDARPQTRHPEQPAGTAAAQSGPTAGGAASRPAGNAIAPAKQRQTRSLLIKLGAVAGAGIALGVVMALSRGTKGNPPGAK